MVWETFKAALRGETISCSARLKREDREKVEVLMLKLLKAEEQHIKDIIAGSDSSESQNALLVVKAALLNEINVKATGEYQTSRTKRYETGEQAGRVLALQLRQEKVRNNIDRIEEDGAEYTETKDILKVFENYYQRLYEYEMPSKKPGEGIQDSGPQLDESIKNKLDEDITSGEISIALHELASGKASGPDGIPLEVSPIWKWTLNNFTKPTATSLVSTTEEHSQSSPETEEDKLLKALIEWPETLGTLTFNSSTSPQNSHFQLLHPKHRYSVGETLEVSVTARDHQRKPKTYGGDFFQAKLHSPLLKAGVTGSVRDHQNGTYTVSFQLLWPGKVEISIRLIHSSEAVHILKRLRDSRPDKIYFVGYFQKNGIMEITECNIEILDKPVCEYRDPRIGEKWFCVRPKQLPCSAFAHLRGGGIRNITTLQEDAFFHKNVTKQLIPGTNSSLQVLPREDTVDAKKLPPCTPGQEITHPSGYYYKDIWASLSCSNKQFRTQQAVSSCLREKIVYMFGDSTLRQWWEYLVDFIPSLKKIDLHVEFPPAGPLLATDAMNGLLVQWRSHGKPLRMSQMMVADLHYMANDIANLGGGPDMVIAINLWAHFTSFPVEVYIRRLRNIRTAVMELLERSPNTTVILKTANTGHNYGSNWLSFQLDLIMRKMFSGLQVGIVDAWEMTSCHYLEENLHPKRIIIQHQMDMFLSFICPS
ncbi:NXPE family member 3-like [Lissotriton helveticus]